MFVALKLVAILAVAAPSVFAGNIKTAVKFPNQGMYESFLAGIDMQLEKDKERRKEYMYIPQVRDPRYDVDRHGQEFIRCREYNETDLDGGKNVRCTRRSAMFDPICTLTINYDKQQIRGGCMEVPTEDQNCQTSCIIKKGTYQFQYDSTRTVAIGNCCCKSYMCNSDYKDIIRNELAARRIRRDGNKGHHHHHHNEEEEEGTTESVDSVTAFFNSLL